MRLSGQDVWGMELLLDLKGCDPALMTRATTERFMAALCERIGMRRVGELLFWENTSGDPTLHGPSAYQYIETSNIGLHFLSLVGAIYVNIFTCKAFDPRDAESFCRDFWGAASASSTVVPRQ
jgi:S-adenosylmethionine decarboxylase